MHRYYGGNLPCVFEKEAEGFDIGFMELRSRYLTINFGDSMQRQIMLPVVRTVHPNFPIIYLIYCGICSVCSSIRLSLSQVAGFVFIHC